MQLTRENEQRLPVTSPPLRSLEIRSTLFRCITHTTRVRLKLFDRQAEAFNETLINVSLNANQTAKRLSNNNTVSSQRNIHVIGI